MWVAGWALLLAGPVSATPMSIQWNVVFTSDASVVSLGMHDVGVIDIDASDSLIDFRWDFVAVIDSDVDTVGMSSVARDAAGDVVAANLFGFNAAFDSVSLSTNGNISHLFAFSAGGVSATGTYAFAAAPMPEPSAALLFGIGSLAVARASRRSPLH